MPVSLKKKGRNVVLTKQGKHYLEYVDAALSELERGHDYLRKDRSLTDGYIDLGIVTSIEHARIPQWIQGFRDSTKKNIFFSCKSGTSQRLIEGLKNNQFDLIFCTGLMSGPQIQFVPVYEQIWVAVVPSGHRFAARKTVHIREMEPEDIIIHTRSSAIWDLTNQIYRDAKVTIRPVSEAEEDQTIIGLVQAGIGCAVMTDNPGIHSEGVAVIPLAGIRRRRYICMGYRLDQSRSQMAELFRRHIMESESVRKLQE